MRALDFIANDRSFAARPPYQYLYLLVGEAPARDPRRTGLQWALAMRALGVPRPWSIAALGEIGGKWAVDWCAVTRHANLLDAWPGSSGRGSAFPAAAGREAATRLRSHLVEFGCPYSGILLVGRRVAGAFGVERRYFEEFAFAGTRAWIVPHPSGASAWWNDDANRLQAEEFLYGLDTSS